MASRSVHEPTGSAMMKSGRVRETMFLADDIRSLNRQQKQPLRTSVVSKPFALENWVSTNASP